MNRKPFYRKVAYCAAIAVLLLPLSWLGQPPAGEAGRGGKLADLREEYDLSQSQLGDIDPASETMRLGTLGLSGVAATILWHKAIEFQKVKDWSNFMASVNQIIKLQPNFIKVWEYQAHNVSYNTSVEFDDYKYRYAWVKRGIDFLIEGTRYNRDEPRLLAYTGHFFGQKIGRADEATQFRRMFATDRDFHAEFSHLVDIDDAMGQSGLPDNWLVSRLWYLRAQDIVDNRPDRPLRGESPLIFHSHPAKARINYAIFNEKDGYHGERSRKDWERGLRDWAQDYGSRQITTSFGHTLRLNERENIQANIALLKTELEKTAGVTFDQIRKEKLAKLSPEMQEAIATPYEKRSQEQMRLSYDPKAMIQIEPSELAKRAPKDRQDEAERQAAAVADLELLSYRIGHYRQTVNYEYWKTRCEVEMTELADQARQLVHDADELGKSAQLVNAKEKYEAAWQAWAKLFQQYPALKDDIMAEELVPSIQHYEEVLGHLEEKLPKDFALLDILVAFDERYRMQQEMRQREAMKAAGYTSPGVENNDTPPEATPSVILPGTSPNSPQKPAPAASAQPGDDPRAREPKPPTAPEEEGA